MLAELREGDATGEIAAIYAEIRRLWSVPYVSSLQRHLATRPGWLEWAWTTLGPAFESGRAQAAAWRAVERLDVPPLPPMSREALRVWGVDASGEAAIRAACASFVRVAPVNLVFSGLLRSFLAGDRPAGARSGSGPAWTPPAPLGALPPLVDPAVLSSPERAVLLRLATPAEDGPFVPGLYRMLASWPPFLAHVATVLPPRLADPATVTSSRQLLEAIDVETSGVFATLAPPPPLPPATEFASVRAALDTYRKTSPEMVLAGRMLAQALPPSP